MRCNPKHKSKTDCWLLIKNISVVSEKKRIEKDLARHLREKFNITPTIHLCNKFPENLNPGDVKITYKNHQFCMEE